MAETDGSEAQLLASNEDDGSNVVPTVPRRRIIVVEPYLLLYVITGLPMLSIKSQFLYQKVGQTLGVDPYSLNMTGNCDINTSDPNYILREKVQAETARWNMYLELAQLLPGVLVSLVLGVYSDHIGRRILFILPTIGSMLTPFVYMAVIQFDLSIGFLFLQTLEYCFGGLETLIIATFSYLADTVPEDRRAFRMAVVDTILLLGASVAELFVGYWIKAQGFFWPCVFVAAGKVVCLLYAIFIIPESVEQSPTRGHVSFADITKGLSIYTKDDGTGRRWKVNVLVISYFVGEMVFVFGILTLFEMNTPLCWNSVLIGFFGSGSLLLKCLATLFAVWVLKKLLTEEWLIFVGRVSAILEYVYLAFVTSTVMMFFAPILGCLNFLALPVTRAVLSKHVKSQEHGALFAVLACLGKLASLTSSLITNPIYAATLMFMNGFVFLIAAFAQFVSLLLILIYIFKTRSKRQGDLTDVTHIQDT